MSKKKSSESIENKKKRYQSVLQTKGSEPVDDLYTLTHGSLPAANFPSLVSLVEGPE